MAEEADAPEGELGPNAAPEQGKDEQQPEPQPEPGPIETLASDLGWTPRDQFKGNPDDWKPADEFIRAGRDIQKSLSKELREVKSTVSNMSRVSQTLLEQQLRDRDAFWMSKQQEAFEGGDKDAFEQATQQRTLIQQQAPANQPPPEVQDFADRNAGWFNRDPMATQYAYQVCEMNKHLPAGEQLKFAEAEVRKRFPEHFQGQSTQTKDPPQVNAPANRGASRGNGKKGFHDMPRAAQEAAQAFNKNHGVPLEEYTARYFQREGAVQ